MVNTNRDEISDDKTYELIEGDDTIYLLKSTNQELTAPTQERVEFIPHYDTLVKSGMYEYYASEGQNPLPFAFAELVDNALAATANNEDLRSIEIRLMFDDSIGKHAVCVLDNGRGMTPKELNNWAVYRLSKFNRPQVTLKQSTDGGPPRSLNSDISYFGVGGKQAIFFIGSATRMVTKTKDCSDVHELCISKDEFERKERSRESIYSGHIINRRAGDVAHIPTEEDNVKKIIAEETKKSNFTAVIITGISPEHSAYLKTHFPHWSKQLAHIYHYYIHGPKGNENIVSKSEVPFKKIDLNVVLHEKGKQPKKMDLTSIKEDMQTLYIRSAASVFEFRAHVDNGGVVEGVLRYHPFLYDKETYPALEMDDKPVGKNLVVYSHAPRGYRPIFECYWNGRLIPYTTIDTLEWCQPAKKRTNIPQECYNRFSGVLWTNDAFQVSTNKLTFMDLEGKLKDKSTIYNRVVLGQEQRVQISRAFHDWIRECHENHDKQVKFISFQEQIKRSDLTQKRHHSPWSVFKAIEWDGKVFKAGQLVRSQRTVPVVCGTVKRFLLFGDHDEDVFATGGEMEIIQEPVALYGDVKYLPLARLDRSISTIQIKKFIEEEERKLPSKLVVTWPEGEQLLPDSKVPAGTTIGAMRVDIVNGKGESMNKIPSDRRKLLVELKVIWHEKGDDKVLNTHVCQHGGKSWPYWFRKMENITHLGPYTLQLKVLLSDSSNSSVIKNLPVYQIKFVVTEAPPTSFTFGMLDNPLRVGVPFQIPVNLLDEYDNPTKLQSDITPVLSASGLELSHAGTFTKGNSLIIKNVVAVGSIPSNAGKDFNLKLTLPGLQEDLQSLKIRLLPGPPCKLEVLPATKEVTVENGTPLDLMVQVQDKAGNATIQQRLNVVCKLSGHPNLPSYTADCSSTGKAALTGPELSVKLNNNTSLKLTATIELQHYKDVPSVEKALIVIPSKRAGHIRVYHLPIGAKQQNRLTDGQELPCVVGETVTGLSFKILDEGERELDIDNNLSSKIKVNWVPKSSRDMLKQGILPDVKAPTSCDESKFCQINLLGAAGLDFSFTLRPEPGVPSLIKLACSDPKLPLGEAMKSEIFVTFYDKHGNKVTKLPPNVLPLFHVSAFGLKEKEVQIGLTHDQTVVIKNIQFEGVPLGPQELTFQWQKLKSFLRVEVVSGPPEKLALININTIEVTSPCTCVLRVGQGSSEPNVKIVLNTDKGLKLTPPPVPTKTNSKGQACFGSPTISATKGLYGIRIKALHGRSSFDAPVIMVRVEPDPSKPVKVMSTFNKQDSCEVGELLPTVSAHVLAEDGCPMKSASNKDIVLKIWHTKDGPVSTKPPQRATTLYPSKRTNKDKAGYFFFRDLKVPEVSGPYCMIVQYGTGSSALTSETMTFSAAAGPPVKLEPEAMPPTPTVSNSQRNANNRCLVKGLRLQLKDRFDNLTGESIRGKVAVSVVSPVDGLDEIPSLCNASASNQIEVHLVKGIAPIPTLHIKENTSGKDGQEYLLSFQAKLPSSAAIHPLPPLTIPFLFYNDVRKKQQMAQLTQERDHLFETIRTYRSLFDTTRQLIQEMRVSVHEACNQEQKLRGELRKNNVPVNNLATPQAVQTYLTSLLKKREELERTPRRQCGLSPGPRGDPEVLGKVAHLAQVEDDAVARVLSWHMASDMDCVVTLTTSKAKEVYSQSNGQQQVLPLDSIYRRSLPEWTRPLPHIRNGPRNYSPPGNPVYARDMLRFPAETDNCKTVFGMLLGDTIILDDLDSANKYRQEVVKFSHCPTILTRSGDRIRSNGKFGGLQNKAPLIERMRGVVFSAPLPEQHHRITVQIEQLQGYKQALVRHAEAKSDLELQLEQGQTEEMKIKHRECREAENQLRLIEQRLGMTPTQYDMPASPATMLHTELNTPPSRAAQSRNRTATTLSPLNTPSGTTTSAARTTVNGVNGTPRTRRSTTS
ncbi:predicted protein [Nematostella vectensis]|uniref:SMC hinge domain-containing protein n=1 Tax=Nematostella vectensis TaxID=45351 RepID=A7SI31_NEMVE|nr:predicted protein [Nematostella vectensis]|eukprot:XP_001628743.1 predicted protein [Nematostella vectensis]